MNKKISSKGGKRTAKKYGRRHMKKIGSLGGQATKRKWLSFKEVVVPYKGMEY